MMDFFGWLWKRGMDKAASRGAIDGSRALFRSGREHLRYQDGERYIDIYCEGSGNEIVVDASSIRAWHKHRYMSAVEVLREQAYIANCTVEEAKQVLKTVVDVLTVRYPKARILVQGNEPA